MFLPETLDYINKKLERHFGVDISGKPYFRVVFSEDQFEKRLGDYEDFDENGNFLRRVREVREAPKYRQWIREKYVLEGLTVVPLQNMEELPTQVLSYEPLWVFEDRIGNPLPPLYRACEFILHRVRSQMENKGIGKYKEEQIPDQERLEKLEEELFGNETPVGDALAHKFGVSLTGPKKES